MSEPTLEEILEEFDFWTDELLMDHPKWKAIRAVLVEWAELKAKVGEWKKRLGERASVLEEIRDFGEGGKKIHYNVTHAPVDWKTRHIDPPECPIGAIGTEPLCERAAPEVGEEFVEKWAWELMEANKPRLLKLLPEMLREAAVTVRGK